jgi:hypothetical protein
MSLRWIMHSSFAMLMVSWWSVLGLPPVLSLKIALKSTPSAKPYSHIRGNQSLYAVLICKARCNSRPLTVGRSPPL